MKMMKVFISFIVIYFFITSSSGDCLSIDIETGSNTLNINDIPRLEGEKEPPLIIFYKDSSYIGFSQNSRKRTTENSLEIYVAIWGNGRIIWSMPDDNNLKPHSRLAYYESYITQKQLHDFWEKYKEIKSWQYFGAGEGSLEAPLCFLQVSGRHTRNSFAKFILFP
jgi:hypothetical protein